MIAAAALGVLLAAQSPAGHAQRSPDPGALQQQLQQMQLRMDEIKQQLDALDRQGQGAQAASADTRSNAAGTTAPQPGKPASLTWHGITLYGTVDIGVAYLTHGAPLSATYPSGLPFLVQKFSNRSITSVAPNGLSQSKIGLSGVEPIIEGLSGVFKLETGFNPTSGRLSDGPASLVVNNGVPLNRQTMASDSSRAGQAFQGGAYAGLRSTTFGTLTFGRQNTPMADNLQKYDPQAQSLAFSPIGISGVSGGLGDTEDKTLDNTLKYTVGYGAGRAAILYQFGSAGSIPEGGEEFDLGADVGGLSVDTLYGKIRGAVSAAALNATQNAAAPGTLAATISDNTGYSVQASYKLKPLKLYAGYEHIEYANPAHPIAADSVDIGGYVLSTVNNTAYTHHKELQISWTGVRYSVTPRFDLTVAYYRYDQNSYRAKHCSNTSAASCSGALNDASLVADYRLTGRFDVYAGVDYSSVLDGMAADYLNNTDWAPMIGVRFNF